MEFRWTKDNHTLPDQLSWRLDVNDVDIEDGGYYVCEGRTMTSSLKSNPVLVSVYQPMKMLAQPSDIVLDYPGFLYYINFYPFLMN